MSVVNLDEYRQTKELRKRAEEKLHYLAQHLPEAIDLQMSDGTTRTVDILNAVCLRDVLILEVYDEIADGIAYLRMEFKDGKLSEEVTAASEEEVTAFHKVLKTIEEKALQGQPQPYGWMKVDMVLDTKEET